MPTVEEKIVTAMEERNAAEQRFREILREGRAAGMSWSQLATATGLSLPGVRYLTLDLNERRKAQRKGGEDGRKSRGKEAD